MKEKELEKLTGLSRRQIIQLQKRVINRRNTCTVGIAYEYNDDEIKEFLLAKFLKDCGYNYNNIKQKLIMFQNSPEEVINDALNKINFEIKKMKEIMNVGKTMINEFKKGKIKNNEKNN